MEHWYTLHTKPNSEYLLARALQQREIQTYLPEIESAKVGQAHQREPFFPSYLFIKVDFEVMGLTGVQWTPGLRRIVAFDGQPASLPDAVIDLIRRKVDQFNAAGGWPALSFKTGDTVRITTGPLEGLLAIFDRPSTSQQRVQVLLEILGQVSRVQVDPANLEKVPPGGGVAPSKPPRRTRGRGRRIKSST